MEPWENEPNSKDFQAHGLQCALRRNSRTFAWCGYVRVGKDHPLYGKSYNSKVKTPASLLSEPIGVRGPIPMVLFMWQEDKSIVSLELLFNVHGGLTFSDSQVYSDPPISTEDSWWFGFDCSHDGDLSPGYAAHGLELSGIYRDINYVTGQTEGLAKQLADMAI
jgi:hypothetical protein